MTLVMLAVQAADSIATAIGTDVGAQVTGLVLLGLGLVNKVLVSVIKIASDATLKLPAIAQMVIALVLGQAIAFVNVKFGVALPTELSGLDVGLQGVVISLVSMGWHGVSKQLPIKRPV